MKKILITGGAVHAHLDAVKIVTNKFRGGLMASLGEDLITRSEVHYICSSDLGAKVPESGACALYEHRGIADYKRLVLQLAPQMDAVILGAAVANLIPAKPFEGKFPSHNYKPGDFINIPFMIAPRVIDEVKKVASKTHLFGFKLLDGAPHEELIRAAYDIVLASGATAVFANDAHDLNHVEAVTKERAVHPIKRAKLADWIWEMVNDEYYYTAYADESLETPMFLARKENLQRIIASHEHEFSANENGIRFGTAAVRYGSGFLTTSRGKRELDQVVHVLSVDHEKREVVVNEGIKATLNAPLLDKLFQNHNIRFIVHYHRQQDGMPTYPYAPAGTVRDTNRPNHTSFNIAGHGCMLLFAADGRRL